MVVVVVLVVLMVALVALVPVVGVGVVAAVRVLKVIARLKWKEMGEARMRTQTRSSLQRAPPRASEGRPHCHQHHQDQRRRR